MDRQGREQQYLTCEKNWVFLMLMFVSGFLGAYTYLLHGGVFCNAQTGNFLMMAVALGESGWRGALYYFIPFAAYLAGTILSESIAGPVRKLQFLRWDTIFVLLEMLAVLCLWLLPEEAPDQITQVTTNFICSMQYNTFRQAEGIPMATTFCTNHVRQLGVSVSKGLRGKGRGNWTRAGKHGGMLIAFVAGCTSLTALSRIWGTDALMFVMIPLGIVLMALIHSDVYKESGDFKQVPRGH